MTIGPVPITFLCLIIGVCILISPFSRLVDWADAHKTKEANKRG